MSDVNCCFPVKGRFERTESLDFFQTHVKEMGDGGQKPVLLLSDSSSSWALLGDEGRCKNVPLFDTRAPFLALVPVLEGSLYIPGHDAHLTSGAFSLLCLQSSWKDYQT